MNANLSQAQAGGGFFFWMTMIMQQRLASELTPQARQRGLMVALVTWFLMNAGFFLIIPLLSVHYVDDLGWAAAFIGVVLAVRQFAQQGLAVLGGALADRFGAKGLIALGTLVRTFSFVLIGFATTPAMLLLGGVLAALGGAMFDAPLRAAVAALAPAQQLGDLYARIGVLQNLARTVGPIVGAFLIQYDFAYVGGAAAGFFLLAFLLVLVGMPAVRVSTEKQPMTQGLNLAFHDRPFLLYTALMMGFWFMWTQLSIAMPLEVKALTGSDSSVGVLFTVNAVMAIVLQVPLLRLAQRFLQPMPMIIVGIVSMAFSLGTVALVETVWHLYVSVFFFAAGIVLVMPNAETIAASLANPTARGAYFGVNSLALAVGGGIGHITGGALVDYAVASGAHMLPWVTFGLVGLLTAVAMLQFYRHNRVRMTPGLALAVAD